MAGPITYKNVAADFGAANSLFSNSAAGLKNVGTGIGQLHDINTAISLKKQEEQKQALLNNELGILASANTIKQAQQPLNFGSLGAMGTQLFKAQQDKIGMLDTLNNSTTNRTNSTNSTNSGVTRNNTLNSNTKAVTKEIAPNAKTQRSTQERNAYSAWSNAANNAEKTHNQNIQYGQTLEYNKQRDAADRTAKIAASGKSGSTSGLALSKRIETAYTAGKSKGLTGKALKTFSLANAGIKGSALKNGETFYDNLFTNNSKEYSAGAIGTLNNQAMDIQIKDMNPEDQRGYSGVNAGIQPGKIMRIGSGQAKLTGDMSLVLTTALRSLNKGGFFGKTPEEAQGLLEALAKEKFPDAFTPVTAK